MLLLLPCGGIDLKMWMNLSVMHTFLPVLWSNNEAIGI